MNNARVDEEGNLRTERERAEILKEEVEYLERAASLQSQWGINSIITNATNSTGGIFNDDVSKNLEDYASAYDNAEQHLTSFISKYETQAQQMVEIAKSNNSTFATEAASLTTWQEQFSLLVREQGRFVSAWDAIREQIKPSTLRYGKLRTKEWARLYTEWGDDDALGKAKQTVEKDLDEFMKSIKTSFGRKGVVFSQELSGPVKIALSQIASKLFEGIADLPENQQLSFKEMFRSYFNLDMDDSVLTEEMRSMVEKNFSQLDKDLAEKIRSGRELSDAEKEQAKQFMENFKNEIVAKFPTLATRLQQLLDDNQWRATVLLSFNRNQDLASWKQHLIEIWGSESPEIVAAIKAAPDVMSAYTALAELRKETNEWLTKFGTLKLPVGFVYQPGKLFDENQINSLTDPIARQMLLDANQRIATINSLTAGQSTSGVNLANFEKNKNKGKGNHTDKFLEQMKERMNLLKKAYDEYKKWLALVDKEEALAKVKGSGIFDALFSGNAPVDLDDYKGELQKLLNQLEGKANTKGRRELVVSIKTLLNLDMPRDEVKETAESLKTQMEAEISRIGKEWDLYKQFVDAGASKKEASLFAFGLDSAPFKNQAEAQAKRVEEFMRDKGIEIPFTTSIEDATEQLGGADSPLYNMFFKAWKEVKEAIEKDELEIRIREVTAINKYKSIAEKIASLNEKYGTYTGLEVGESGELEEKEGMTAGQRATFREYQDKLAELKGELLTLLPIWEQIFGDHTYQSYGQIQKAADVVRQIVSNASVQKDADGKPTIYTSSYVDDEGKTVNVSGQYSQLEKLKKALDDLYKEGVKKILLQPSPKTSKMCLRAAVT